MTYIFKNFKIFFLVNIWSVKKRAGSTLAQYSKTLPPMPHRDSSLHSPMGSQIGSCKILTKNAIFATRRPKPRW